jgi:hypothetical protein
MVPLLQQGLPGNSFRIHQALFISLEPGVSPADTVGHGQRRTESSGQPRWGTQRR